MNTRLRFALGAAAMAVWLAAGANAQTLTMSLAAAPTSVDPHYHTFGPNETLDIHVFDLLTDFDAGMHLQPALATSWKLIDDTTWEFKLRAGVKFHNGADFTAEDVAYTIDRVPTVVNSPGSFTVYTKPVTRVEIIDPLTIRMHTAGVFPLLPTSMSQVFIIPHGLGKWPATEDFNSGKNAIGTGPYRMLSYKSGDRVELERNDSWWGPKPHWQHVTMRMIPNDAARSAALLAGDVQFIEFVPPADATRMRSDKRVALAETDSLRFVYLWLDRSRQGDEPFVSGPDGEKLGRNPFNDLRVRQALSMAINRPLIVERIMENEATPTGQFLAAGAYSHVPGLEAPKYDPERAKALLADAGYPNGFRLTLHGPNDRYVNDAKIIQAIGQMWSRIGVQTTVDAMTWTSYIGRASRQEFSAYLLAWGIATGEASDPLRALIETFSTEKGVGSVNRARYSNPTLDALIDKAVATPDDAAREKLLIEATKMAMDDVAIVPLHIQKNIWGMQAGLTYAARADEGTRAMDVRPAN